MESNIPKQFIEVNGKPILMHTIAKFSMCDAIILVLPKDQIKIWDNLCEKHQFKTDHKIVNGGRSRFQSVKKGLEIVEGNSLVAIHDGVRPIISENIINTSFEEASSNGSAITSMPLKYSLREISENENSHVDRTLYREIQTPQTFQSTLIKKAYQQEESSLFTDDASVLENDGCEIQLIDGNYKNIKITTPEDLIIAEAYLSSPS